MMPDNNELRIKIIIELYYPNNPVSCFPCIIIACSNPGPVIPRFCIIWSVPIKKLSCRIMAVKVKFIRLQHNPQIIYENPDLQVIKAVTALIIGIDKHEINVSAGKIRDSYHPYNPKSENNGKKDFMALHQKHPYIL